MAHVQLRRKSGERVLPVFYSDNYVSLVPRRDQDRYDRRGGQRLQRRRRAGGGRRMECDGGGGIVHGVTIEPNVEAQPEHWPVTGLPLATAGLR